MESQVRTIAYESGEVQRVQTVTLDSWEQLQFLQPRTTPEALAHLAAIYRDFFVAQAPYYFGKLTFFHIPEEVELPFSVKGIEEPHTAAKIYMKRHPLKGSVRRFQRQLSRLGYCYVVRGKNPFRNVLMPYKAIGFLSAEKPQSAVRVNSSFFTFDVLDVDSPYDLFGTPVGLQVKDGQVLSPPLFHREALLVDGTGQVTVRPVELEELTLNISGTVYQRPDCRRTPFAKGTDVVIIGDRIIAVRPGGHTLVPTTGFVVHTRETGWKAGDKIEYKGMEDICFAIQCGNSVVVNGRKTEGFVSPFYHWLKWGEKKYPPGRYPHDFAKDRAPRMVLGSNAEGKPVLLWAEGAGKARYTAGADSCGASLQELGSLAEAVGLVNGVNLDGGGSAQILWKGKRSLLISDRNFADNSESERPVPAGLFAE